METRPCGHAKVTTDCAARMSVHERLMAPDARELRSLYLLFWAMSGGSFLPMSFQSMLFAKTDDVRVDGQEKPAFFHDLHLDQIVDAILSGREEYRLEGFFYAPLHDVESVNFRQEVFRDLETDALFHSVSTFGQSMRTMRQYLALSDKLHYKYEKERWFLDAAAVYCYAVKALETELMRANLTSRAFIAFRDYLMGYTSSQAFLSLVEATQTAKDALAEVSYLIHISENRVRVSKYSGEVDLGQEVENTFAKFKIGASKDYRVKFYGRTGMNHIEAQIVELVARLYPEVFRALDEYYAAHQGYVDPLVSTFEREIQFYLAYLEFTAPLKAAGLQFCYPRVAEHAREVRATNAFDLALAKKLVGEGGVVVCNDFQLTDQERIIVVTGPNQGGKTTFARMFGQIHYLAAIGCPVPGKEAQLALPDHVLTHFEREEDIATMRGKLEDELLRMYELFQKATGRSVLILNESFSSTSLSDALFIGQEVMKRILKLGALCVYVTFVDELAALDPAIVSMVATVTPDDTMRRTFKLVRKPPDGLAYAAAIAEKYGLTYQAIKRRLSP